MVSGAALLVVFAVAVRDRRVPLRRRPGRARSTSGGRGSGRARASRWWGAGRARRRSWRRSAGALHLNVAAVTAGLASALGVAVGAAAAALVRRAARGAPRRRGCSPGSSRASSPSTSSPATWPISCVAVTFLAAAACLAGARRSWWAAALLLAGGGLAHPPFLVHAIVVLAGAAVLAWRAGAHDEARDIALSVAAGGVVAGAGILATIAGPGPIAAETSKDGYLRRAGLDAAARRRVPRAVPAPGGALRPVDLGPARRRRDGGRRCLGGGRVPPAVPRVVARGDGGRYPGGLRHGMAPAGPARHVRVRRADRRGAGGRVAPRQAGRAAVAGEGGRRRRSPDG